MLKLARIQTGEPEIFASIQGEGASIGRPSTFVRLALCNLACSWCDTKYTWDWAHFEIVLASDVEIIERVTSLGVVNVVVSGGEPLMQQDALAAIAEQLARTGHRIEIETNGTFRPNSSLQRDISQWNVSPKLTTSGDAARLRLIDRPLEWFAQSENAWFKFVIDIPSDLEEVSEIMNKYAVPRERVILMPLGTSIEELDERSAWLADACVRRGYRFSTRMHILLWGDERGR